MGADRPGQTYLCQTNLMIGAHMYRARPPVTQGPWPQPPLQAGPQSRYFLPSATPPKQATKIRAERKSVQTTHQDRYSVRPQV